MKYSVEKTMSGFFTRRYFETYHKVKNLKLTSEINSNEEIQRVILLPFLLLDLSYNDLCNSENSQFKHKAKQYLNKVTFHTSALWKDFWRDYDGDKDTANYILELMDQLEDNLSNDYKLLNLSIMKNFDEIDDMEIKKLISKVEVYTIFLQISNKMFEKILRKPINMITQLEKETETLGNCIYCDFTKDQKKDVNLNQDNDVIAFVRNIIDKTMEFITIDK